MVEFEERKITIAPHSGKSLCAKNELVARELKGLLWVNMTRCRPWRSLTLSPHKLSTSGREANVDAICPRSTVDPSSAPDQLRICARQPPLHSTSKPTAILDLAGR